MKSFKNIISLLALLTIPFFAAGAPGNEPAENPDKDLRTVKITATDRMKFDVTEITAKPGEQIRIVLTVVSNIPKSAMAHNVVILKAGTDAEAFANASAMAADNAYIAPELEDQVVAATPLAGGGETVEVTFTAPQHAGEYTYICSFPGHYWAGMKGILTVEQPST